MAWVGLEPRAVCLLCEHYFTELLSHLAILPTMFHLKPSPVTITPNILTHFKRIGFLIWNCINCSVTFNEWYKMSPKIYGKKWIIQNPPKCMDKININKLWVRDFHFAKDIYFTLTPQYKKWDIIGVKRKILSVNV